MFCLWIGLHCFFFLHTTRQDNMGFFLLFFCNYFIGLKTFLPIGCEIICWMKGASCYFDLGILGIKIIQIRIAFNQKNIYSLLFIFVNFLSISHENLLWSCLARVILHAFIVSQIVNIAAVVFTYIWRVQK